MRRIREVLRLKFELGLTSRQIARGCSISHSTVREYVRRAREAGVSWPLAEDVDDAKLEERLFAETNKLALEIRPQPDFKTIHQELQSNKHVTRQLLWQEYKQANPEGYQYTQFCDLYKSWAKKLDLVLRQPHRAGEKLFVDYAGPKVPVVDGRSGEIIIEASIFVAVLGASNYSYAEASAKQDLAAWIEAHVRAFEFIGGCPAIVVPDNPKVGVIHPCRYEPELNQTYEEMAAHYGVAVIPARRRKPRDKAYVSYCTLLRLSNGESWLLSPSASATFDDGVVGQRFV